MSEKSPFVITHKKSTTWYVIVATTVSVLGIFIFYWGKKAGQSHEKALQSEVHQLGVLVGDKEKTIATLQTSLDEHKARVGLLEADQRLTATSQSKLKETVAALEEKIRAQEKELSFFKNVMSPEDSRKGFQIEKLVTEPVLESGDIKFRLSLIQAKKHNSHVRGTVNVELIGIADGKARTVSLSSITDKPKNWNFKFKYLQHIKGQFTIPEGLLIKRVKVTAKLKGRKPLTVAKEFPWQLTETELNVDEQKKQKQTQG